MKSILILLSLIAGLAFGQQQVFQVTASQGDGSTCTAIQNNGTNVNLTINCVSVYQGKPSGSYHIYEGGNVQVKVPIIHTVQLGDVLCMFGDNATNYTVNLVGFPSTPAHSLAYNCVVNVRTSGTVTGNVPGPSGVVTWTTSTRGFWSRLFRP
jgi:hypothetical protein